MFTDGPITPLRVEILVDVVRALGPIGTKALGRLLQPGYEKKDQTRQTVRAARELGLVTLEGNELLCVAARRSTREATLDAFDLTVLGGTDTEPYLARYYSYLLGLGKDADTPSSTRAADFVRHSGLDNMSNQFNAEKERALPRWYVWAGLGWEYGGRFMCNPYERLSRSLPAVFRTDKSLPSGAFAERLGSICPELDGGKIYREVWPDWSADQRRFSLGLSHALIELHEAGKILLHAPPDARGWSIEVADPPNDGKVLRGGVIDLVEMCEVPE